jgi:hypothetical protein
MSTNEHCLNCHKQGTVVIAPNGVDKFCTSECEKEYKAKLSPANPALERDAYIAKLEGTLKGYRVLQGNCAQCGNLHAYRGAIYCGGACTARSEAHERLVFREFDKDKTKEAS